MNLSVLVTNTGDLSGGYQLSLKIDDVDVETRDVALPGGESERVSFNITLDTAGAQTINIGDFHEILEVKPVLSPANIIISDVIVSPAEVDIGENVTITTHLANSGELSGTESIKLEVNSIVVETKEVTVSGGGSQVVTFTIDRDTPGTYTVSVGESSGAFTVRGREAALSPAPTPVAPQTPTTPIKWPALIGVIVGVVVVGLLIFRVARGSNY